MFWLSRRPVASEATRSPLAHFARPQPASASAPAAPSSTCPVAPQTILSFDVEEHDRIEAAASLKLGNDWRDYCRERLAPPTRWLLAELGERGIRATFFVVGAIAQHEPALIRAIHGAGHEVASHSWAHARASTLPPEDFRRDLRQSRDALEQVTGERVVGYRAPTFSIGRRNAWAIDILAEEGFLYDSSIYPVRHDRYGEPSAPRAPFVARGIGREMLEFPPLTLQLCGANVPVGGGGYFRLFPLALTESGLRQSTRTLAPPVATLYFHPWEFDPDQRPLPLPRLSRFRTYVGITRSRKKLTALLSRHRFSRAIDVAQQLSLHVDHLPRFALSDSAAGASTAGARGPSD